jgi:hypothetical protein
LKGVGGQVGAPRAGEQRRPVEGDAPGEQPARRGERGLCVGGVDALGGQEGGGFVAVVEAAGPERREYCRRTEL